MSRFAVLVALTMLASGVIAEDRDSASCGAMTVRDKCRITWSISRAGSLYYFVQQFDSLSADWESVVSLPAGTSSSGSLASPVEAGNLYRVLACDDVHGTQNCSGTTVVWAPFVQPEDQVDLIPSRVPLIGSEAAVGEPTYGLISKKGSWLSQVTQYNIIQMTNTIARAKVSELPEMTPVKDIRVEMPSDPIEQVQFNVYRFYSAQLGLPIDQPAPEPDPTWVAPPHVHPERHPDDTSPPQ